MFKLQTLLIALLMISPAHAFSGAEFLSAHPNFAEGYAWGALESRMLVLTDNEEDRLGQFNLQRCLSSASINSGIFVEAVITEIKSDPANLTLPALSPILKTVRRMCPAQ